MTNRLLDEKDMNIVKDAIVYPYVLTTLEYDINAMSSSKLKMKDLYILQLRKLQDDVTKGHYEFRKEMRTRGVKILSEQRHEEHFETECLIRGYVHKYQMSFTLLKQLIQEKLSIYMSLNTKNETTIH